MLGVESTETCRHLNKTTLFTTNCGYKGLPVGMSTNPSFRPRKERIISLCRARNSLCLKTFNSVSLIFSPYFFSLSSTVSWSKCQIPPTCQNKSNTDLSLTRSPVWGGAPVSPIICKVPIRGLLILPRKNTGKNCKRDPKLAGSWRACLRKL